MPALRRSNRIAAYHPRNNVAAAQASSLPSIELERLAETEVSELGKAVVHEGNEIRIKSVAPHRLPDSLSNDPALPDAAIPAAVQEVPVSRRCHQPTHTPPKSERAGKVSCRRPAPKRASPKRYFYSEPEEGGKDLRKRKIPHLGEIEADGSRKRMRNESKSPSSDIAEVNTRTSAGVSDTAVAPRNGTIIRIPAAARHWRRTKLAARSRSPSPDSPAVKLEREMSPRASEPELKRVSSPRPSPPVKDEPSISPSAATQNGIGTYTRRIIALLPMRRGTPDAFSPRTQATTEAPTPLGAHRPGHVSARHVGREPPPAPRWLPRDEGEVRRLLALLHNVFGQLMYEVLSEQLDLPVETVLDGLYSAYQHLDRSLQLPPLTREKEGSDAGVKPEDA